MFLFDELFVKCLHMAGVCSENEPCVTTNLNTNFKNAVPSESYAVLTVGIERNEGKKYYLSGSFTMEIQTLVRPNFSPILVLIFMYSVL